MDAGVLARELELGKSARTREPDQLLQELLAVPTATIGFVGDDIFYEAHILLERCQKAQADHGDRSPLRMESTDPDEDRLAQDAA